MSQARVQLTQEEEDFFRVILYHAVSDEQAQPYLRKAFYRLIPVAVEGSKTMSIDEHWRVYIDFEEMMRRGSSYATGILHHEIWHPLRNHHKLVETLDAAPAGYNQGAIANLAADLEINDDIAHLIPSNAIKGQRSVFKQYPEHGIFAPYYDKMLEDLEYLEKYFPFIKEKSVAQEPQPKPKPGGEPSDEEEDEGAGEDSQEQGLGEAQGDSQEANEPSESGDEQDGSEPSESSSGSGEDQEDSSPNDSPSSSSDSQEGGEDNQNQEPGSPSSDEATSDDSSQGENPSDDGNASDSGSPSAPPFPGQGSGQSPAQPAGSDVKQVPPFPGAIQKPVSPFPKSPQENQETSSQNPGQGKDESQSESDQNPNGDIEDSDYWDHPECGSATGNPAEYELPPGAAPEMSESEEESLTKAVARDIQDWLKENSGVGSGQGNNSLGDWAEQRLKAKTVPWQQELRGVFLSAAATVRGKLLYVRNKPSRRQPVPEFMFPALKAPKPTIGIGIDVSGSNLGNLRVILDEIVKMMKSMNVQGRDVEAFAVDVAVSKTKTVSNPLKLLDDLPVGGGTRMKPGYMKLAEMGKDVSLLITDGWVDDYPEERPKGKKRTMFITCIVMKERSKKNDSRVQKAKRIMGKWCKVIPIYVSEMKKSSS